MPRRFRVAIGLLTVALLAAAGWLLLRPKPIEAQPDWQDPLTGMRFIRIEPREFAMGTPDVERRRQPDETLHDVRITRPFYLAEHELTQTQWERLIGTSPSYFAKCGADCPVERVSWEDAQQLLHRLNVRGTPGYRLPTEAEWELACRGFSNMPFGISRGLGGASANVNGQYPYNAPRGIHRRTTVSVKRFDPNWIGLFDMSGNVWEWVQDEYCPYPAGGAVDPVGACGSNRRVVRGGSWSFDAGSARCGARFAQRPDAATSAVGIRLAHDVF